jgi:hypothetical protein
VNTATRRGFTGGSGGDGEGMGEVEGRPSPGELVRWPATGLLSYGPDELGCKSLKIWTRSISSVLLVNGSISHLKRETRHFFIQEQQHQTR